MNQPILMLNMIAKTAHVCSELFSLNISLKMEIFTLEKIK